MEQNDIDLSEQSLTEIPKYVINSDVEYLDISRNFIEIIPEEISQMTNLKELNISRNDIFDIAPICGLITLESLCLNFTNVSFFPKSFENLTNLRTLLLAGMNDKCGILNFETLNLKVLDLSYNKFKEIPKWVTSIKNLESLILEYNEISEISEEIKNLTNLKNLYLTGNKISVIPSFLQKIENIKLVDLRDNPIIEIPDIFKDDTRFKF